MTIRSIAFLTRLSACTTAAQAALAAYDALVEGVPIPEVVDALVHWDELRKTEVQTVVAK